MATDTIRLICPNLRCRSILTAPASTRGKTVRCRACGMKVRVPAPATDPSKNQPGTAPVTETAK